MSRLAAEEVNPRMLDGAEDAEEDRSGSKNGGRSRRQCRYPDRVELHQPLHC